MKESELIQQQVNRTVALLATNITRYYDALFELKRLSLTLLQEKRLDPAAVDDWFANEGFGIDADGFWLSLPLLERFRSGRAPEDAISYSWNPNLKDHPEACFRMYCLRNLGPFLHEIHSRLPGIAWIYYQDITNTAIQFPYIDQITAITPDFDWSTYHTYVSVDPSSNPDRSIRWTPPTIDYAGEGLILSVSIPVYQNNAFIGLWSIDIPMRHLSQDHIIETYVTGQENFLINHEGAIVAHPSISLKIDKEKGSFFQENIKKLGGGFNNLDLTEIMKSKAGKLQLKGGDGQDLLAYYGVVPDINWIFFATVPKCCLVEAINRRIRTAFDRIREGDLTHRLEECHDVGQWNVLIEGYNEMATALQQQEEARLQAERALRESEKKYRLLFENANDAIFITQDERIQFANPKCLETIGYTEEELALLSFFDIIHPDDKNMIRKNSQETMSGERASMTSSFKIINKNAGEIWVQLNAVPISWGDAPALLHFARDITGQKKLESQLHHAQKMETIGKLLSSIAHEFGNPLLGVKFAVRDVHQQLYLAADDKKTLEAAEKECDRMRGLIRDLQRFNRPTSGRRKQFSLHGMLDDLLVFHRSLLARKKVELVKKYDHRDIMVVAVEDQLRQVFVNLLLNAIEAMASLENLLTVITELHEGSVKISIEDNGVGIQPETLGHIFEPFFTTKAEVEGTGLGLSVSYGIIHAHGGMITVCSRPGQTVFDVILPCGSAGNKEAG